MSQSNQKPKSMNEFVFEVRYKPNPKVLDLRGTWAELISEHMGLSEWRIVENRIDIYDKDSDNRSFVGFKNCGFISRDVPTSNYFPDKTIKFFKFVMNFDGFTNPLFVQRVGVRLKTYTQYLKGFDSLRDRYAERYIKISEDAKNILGGKLVDIGGPLNFVDKHENFNTSSGTILSEQAHEFLNRQDVIPEMGFYFDIDYWQRPNKNMNVDDIIKNILVYSTQCWEKNSRVVDLLFKD